MKKVSIVLLFAASSLLVAQAQKVNTVISHEARVSLAYQEALKAAGASNHKEITLDQAIEIAQSYLSGLRDAGVSNIDTISNEDLRYVHKRVRFGEFDFTFDVRSKCLITVVVSTDGAIVKRRTSSWCQSYGI